MPIFRKQIIIQLVPQIIGIKSIYRIDPLCKQVFEPPRDFKVDFVLLRIYLITIFFSKICNFLRYFVHVFGQICLQI